MGLRTCRALQARPPRPWRLSVRLRLCRAPTALLTTHGSGPAPCDVLVLDATNLLCRAAGGNRQPAAAGLKQGFADWLAFLQLLAEPRLVIACFDAPKVRC